MSVATGAMAQTRMRSGASSTASDFVSIMHRALGGVVGRKPRPRPQPRGRADIDDDAADRCLRKCGTTACAEQENAFDVDGKMRSNSSSSISIIGLLTWVTPALLTRISSAPNAASVSAIAASISARLVTSQRTAIALLPICSRRAASPRLVDVDHRDARALARVGFGDAFADARAGAGDERDLAFETHDFTPCYFGATP